MNILHLTGTLATGGIERLVTELALAQRKQGHKVAVGCLLGKRGEFIQQLDDNSIPVFDIGYERSPGKLIARLSRVLGEWQPNVIHSHVNFSVLWQAIANLIAPRRAAFVLTHHTIRKITPVIRLRSVLYDRLSRSLINQYTAVSEYAAQNAASLSRLRTAQIPWVIPNGIHVDGYLFDDSARPTYRHVWNFSDSDVIWGSVGRLAAVKGFDILLESFARARQTVPNIRLVIAGEGPERPYLEAQRVSLGLQDAVNLAGRQADIRGVLSAFDAYVQPSRSESASISILEALANGLPIIGSDVGGIREIAARSACVRLVQPADVEGFAEAIVEITKNAVHRRQQAGIFPPEYTFEAMLSAYERVYEKALGTSSRLS